MKKVKKVKLKKRYEFHQGTVVIQTPSLTTSKDYDYDKFAGHTESSQQNTVHNRFLCRK